MQHLSQTSISGNVYISRVLPVSRAKAVYNDEKEASALYNAFSQYNIKKSDSKKADSAEKDSTGFLYTDKKENIALSADKQMQLCSFNDLIEVQDMINGVLTLFSDACTNDKMNDSIEFFDLYDQLITLNNAKAALENSIGAPGLSGSGISVNKLRVSAEKSRHNYRYTLYRKNLAAIGSL